MGRWRRRLSIIPGHFRFTRISNMRITAWLMPFKKRDEPGKRFSITEKRSQLRPDFFMANYNLARILATDPRPEFRDGRRAILLATKAAEFDHNRSPAPLDILAAAYAETGQYHKAVRIAEQAVGFAGKNGDALMRTNMEQRLNLYRAGMPYYE